MEIFELFNCTNAEFDMLSGLMSELNPSIVLSRESLDRMLSDGSSHLYVAREDDRILGCACLCIYHQPFSTDGTVEAVVVSSDARGKGLGRLLMEHVLSESRQYAPITLHLTSRSSRVAANALYRSLGFSLKETNCYSLTVEH